MKIELCIESGNALLSYWFTEKKYAKNFCQIQKEMLEKEPEKADFWVKQINLYDVRYRYCSKKLFELRKKIIGVGF